VIEHAHRRIRILGLTPPPSAAWVTPAARHLIMDLQDAHCRARFLIRDRDSTSPGLFNATDTDTDTDTDTAGFRSSSPASRCPE
jgi:putative transposase